MRSKLPLAVACILLCAVSVMCAGDTSAQPSKQQQKNAAIIGGNTQALQNPAGNVHSRRSQDALPRKLIQQVQISSTPAAAASAPKLTTADENTMFSIASVMDTTGPTAANELLVEPTPVTNSEAETAATEEQNPAVVLANQAQPTTTPTKEAAAQYYSPLSSSGPTITPGQPSFDQFGGLIFWKRDPVSGRLVPDNWEDGLPTDNPDWGADAFEPVNSGSAVWSTPKPNPSASVTAVAPVAAPAAAPAAQPTTAAPAAVAPATEPVAATQPAAASLSTSPTEQPPAAEAEEPKGPEDVTDTGVAASDSDSDSESETTEVEQVAEEPQATAASAADATAAPAAEQTADSPATAAASVVKQSEPVTATPAQTLPAATTQTSAPATTTTSEPVAATATEPAASQTEEPQAAGPAAAAAASEPAATATPAQPAGTTPAAAAAQPTEAPTTPVAAAPVETPATPTVPAPAAAADAPKDDVIAVPDSQAAAPPDVVVAPAAGDAVAAAATSGFTATIAAQNPTAVDAEVLTSLVPRRNTTRRNAAPADDATKLPSPTTCGQEQWFSCEVPGLCTARQGCECNAKLGSLEHKTNSACRCNAARGFTMATENGVTACAWDLSFGETRYFEVPRLGTVDLPFNLGAAKACPDYPNKVISAVDLAAAKPVTCPRDANFVRLANRRSAAWGTEACAPGTGGHYVLRTTLRGTDRGECRSVKVTTTDMRSHYVVFKYY